MKDDLRDDDLTVYIFNGMCLIPEIHLFELCGKRISLTPIEFHIMHLFMSNPTRIWRLHEIMDWVSEKTGKRYDVLDITVRQSIGRLRFKLFPKNRKFAKEVIFTVYCVGYRLGDFRKKACVP